MSPPDQRSFHIMAKPVGPRCNLRCGYCFYLEKEKLYPETSEWKMPDAVLDSFIRQYIQSQRTPTVTFAWQGGEPTLLDLTFFRRVVELQRNYAGGRLIENTLQTNGINLDDAWCRFLAENRFLVGLSIDGPREMHDRYRVDKGGRPTFDRVMRGLELLRRHGVAFNTLTCLQRHNSRKPLEVYRFLREMGSGFIQFIPVVELAAPAAGTVDPQPIGPGAGRPAVVADWSVQPEPFGRFLCAVFDEWVRRDVGRVYVQHFDVALESWLGGPSSLCVFSEVCGSALALEHNGDLYSCDHFVYPGFRLGNLAETPLETMARSDRQRQFGASKMEALPPRCMDCRFRHACNGGCPKHRFLRAPDGAPGLNYLCAGYKLFFQHIDPCMRFMAGELLQERPPANVMSWLREREIDRGGWRRPGRNELCPCGSGKKTKKCCGRHG